jgi:predicted branched-subunit amino acid permease
MYQRTDIRSHPAFIEGAKDMLPATPGIAAWGLMTGVAMTQSGLSLAESLAMTFIVFAGSAQLASLPLIAAGAPMWVILATAMCINLRFVVFSAHLRAFLKTFPKIERIPLGYIIGDLTYVLFIQRHPKPAETEAGRLEQAAYLAGHSACNWASWIIPSILGSVFAAFIPQHWGLGFAGVLALLGVAASMASNRLRLLAASVAALAAVVAFALPLKLNVLVAIAAAVAVGLLAEHALHRAKKATA